MKLRLLFFLAILLSTPVLLAAPTRIAGQVFNDSQNKPAANANLEFVRAQNGSTPTLAARTRAGADGKFAINLNLNRDDLVFARINWTNHIYVAPVFDGGGKLRAMGMKLDPNNLKLRVYDATTQLVPLSFLVHHLAIKSEDGGLNCIERIVVENPTKKMFLGLGARRATILINLPQAAQNVRLDPQITDAKIEKRPDGWAIIKPISPSLGEGAERNLVIINYDMKWPSKWPWARKLDFSRKIQYPTKFFFVAREDADKKLKIEAPKLSKDQSAPINVGGAPQTRLVNAIGRPMAGGAPALQSGDDLDIKISSPVEPLFWGFLGFVALLLLAVPTAIFARRKPSQKTSTPSHQSEDKIAEPRDESFVLLPPSTAVDFSFNAHAQNLVEQIARLDDEWEQSQIGVEEHQKRRGELKQEIVEQLLQRPRASA